jgi:hypothetical protein
MIAKDKTTERPPTINTSATQVDSIAADLEDTGSLLSDEDLKKEGSSV